MRRNIYRDGDLEIVCAYYESDVSGVRLGGRLVLGVRHGRTISTIFYDTLLDRVSFMNDEPFSPEMLEFAIRFLTDRGAGYLGEDMTPLRDALLRKMI